MLPKHHVRPRPATVAVVAMVFALVGVGSLAVGHGSRSGARHIRCGQKIRRDRTLHRDLVNCRNNGLVIAADGVTLDLNGHTIDGNGKLVRRCPRHTPCDIGVVDAGHDRVTVKHGSVREFGVGVFALRARHNRVLGISSSRNHFVGIVLSESVRGVVRNSSGNRSVTPEGGNGLVLFDSHHVRILHNSFRRNGDQGIFVGKSTHNLIKGNLTLRNKGLAGIILHNGERNQVRRNRSVRDGSVGIYVAPGSGNVIAKNRVSHPFRDVLGGEGAGIEVDGGNRNVIARNSVRNTRGPAISVGFGPAVGNVVRRNHTHGAGEDGVRIDDKAERTLVKRNLAVGSGDDGFNVKSPRTKLSANRALRNAELGIRAVPGVIDGGGNQARGNGDPRQCLNVVCS